jgi:hypothetical protein
VYVVGFYDLSIGRYIGYIVHLTASSAFGVEATYRVLIDRGTGRGNRSLGKH